MEVANPPKQSLEKDSNDATANGGHTPKPRPTLGGVALGVPGAGVALPGRPGGDPGGSWQAVAAWKIPWFLDTLSCAPLLGTRFARTAKCHQEGGASPPP